MTDYPARRSRERRHEVATRIRAMQDLAEDYDLMRIDALIRRVELSRNVEASLSDTSVRQFQIRLLRRSTVTRCEVAATS